MGIWIRTQSRKSLIKASVVGTDFRDERRLIGASDTSVQEVILGEYETEERALEVLGNIQRRLIQGVIHDEIIKGTRYERNSVFQMPQI